MTTASDIWGFGCILTELYNEKRIWNVDNTMKAIQEVHIKKYVPKNLNIPEFLQKTFNQCFSYSPGNRPKASEILKVFIEEKVKQDKNKPV